MGEMILRKPAILYETIEAIYQRVKWYYLQPEKTGYSSEIRTKAIRPGEKPD